MIAYLATLAAVAAQPPVPATQPADAAEHCTHRGAVSLCKSGWTAEVSVSGTKLDFAKGFPLDDRTTFSIGKNGENYNVKFTWISGPAPTDDYIFYAADIGRSSRGYEVTRLNASSVTPCNGTRVAILISVDFGRGVVDSFWRDPGDKRGDRILRVKLDPKFASKDPNSITYDDFLSIIGKDYLKDERKICAAAGMD